MKANKPFAEVIESSLHGFLAQSWDAATLPLFGSLMTITTPERTLFGVVHQIQTGSMDPSRHPFAYKKTYEELRKEQPQIFEFLKTTFNALVIGHTTASGKISYLLAPEPARIHTFVCPSNVEMSVQFFKNTHYMHALFGLAHTVLNLDELLLAMLAHQASLGILSQEKLLDFTTTFSLLTGNDYRRLKLFLQRVEPILQN
ncbi:hypothetical protein JST99_00385 [Candidatus Dependentiae bacterium]|nr:hypothetical protein [Candidatus Dependentiae bacterium]MCC7414851.1 hypothetical protein [Campylobacterota bacterium]